MLAKAIEFIKQVVAYWKIWGGPAIVLGLWRTVAWLRAFLARKHHDAVQQAVATLRREAQALMLKEPNLHAVRKKSFWEALLKKPELINEALEVTAFPMPGTDLYEVDFGQPILISRIGSNSTQQRRHG